MSALPKFSDMQKVRAWVPNYGWGTIAGGRTLFSPASALEDGPDLCDGILIHR